MSTKSYAFASGVIFLAIAILHVLRLFSGWAAVIGGWSVPMWLSWVALVVAGYLAYEGLRIGGGKA